MPDLIPLLRKKFWPDITTVIDSKREIRVEVTTRDRTGASPKDPMKCAFARACRRSLDIDDCVIGLTFAYLKKGKTVLRCALPERIRRELIAFDKASGIPAYYAQEMFSNGKYKLKAIPEGWRLDRIRKPRGKAHSKKTEYSTVPREPAFQITDADGRTPNIRRIFD